MPYILQTSQNRYLGKNRRSRLDFVFSRDAALKFASSDDALKFLRKKVTSKLKSNKWTPVLVDKGKNDVLVKAQDAEVAETPAEPKSTKDVQIYTDKSDYIQASVVSALAVDVDAQAILGAINTLSSEYAKIDAIKADLQAIVSSCDKAVGDILHEIEATDETDKDFADDLMFSQQIRVIRKQRRKAKILLRIHSELCKALSTEFRSGKTQKAIESVQSPDGVVYNARIMNYSALFGNNRIRTKSELLADVTKELRNMEVDDTDGFK